MEHCNSCKNAKTDKCQPVFRLNQETFFSYCINYETDMPICRNKNCRYHLGNDVCSIEPKLNGEKCESFEPINEAKADKGKAKLTLVPRKIIFAIAKIREYGVKKYSDPDNWKKVEKERYRDALYRHFMAYLDNPQGVDEESGLPHLWHLACNVAFLCEMEELDERDVPI